MVQIRAFYFSFYCDLSTSAKSKGMRGQRVREFFGFSISEAVAGWECPHWRQGGGHRESRVPQPHERVRDFCPETTHSRMIPRNDPKCPTLGFLLQKEIHKDSTCKKSQWREKKNEEEKGIFLKLHLTFKSTSTSYTSDVLQMIGSFRCFFVYDLESL